MSACGPASGGMRSPVTGCRLRPFVLALALVVSGCAVPSLKPVTAGRTLDGYALVRKSGDLVAWVVGTSSLTACEVVRTQWEAKDRTSYGSCRPATLDTVAQPPNVYVAVGFNPNLASVVNHFSFIGGPTQGDCDLLRATLSTKNYQAQMQYGWSDVPCRPAVLTVR